MAEQIRKVIDYKSISETSQHEFDRKIKSFINCGWTPQGNMTKTNENGFLEYGYYSYNQAMILYEE